MPCSAAAAQHKTHQAQAAQQQGDALRFRHGRAGRVRGAARRLDGIRGRDGHRGRQVLCRRQRGRCRRADRAALGRVDGTGVRRRGRVVRGRAILVAGRAGGAAGARGRGRRRRIACRRSGHRYRRAGRAVRAGGAAGTVACGRRRRIRAGRAGTRRGRGRPGRRGRGRQRLRQQRTHLVALRVDEFDFHVRFRRGHAGAAERELEHHVVAQRDLLTGKAQAVAGRCLAGAGTAGSVELGLRYRPARRVVQRRADADARVRADALDRQRGQAGGTAPAAAAVGGVDFQGEHVAAPARRERDAVRSQHAGLRRHHRRAEQGSKCAHAQGRFHVEFSWKRCHYGRDCHRV